MRRVCGWMESHGLELALQKTEILIMTNKRIDLDVYLQVGDENIKSKQAIKELGILIDSKLTFWPQIQSAADKAATKTAALSRLMSNVGGPRQVKRILLMTVAMSIMMKRP